MAINPRQSKGPDLSVRRVGRAVYYTTVRGILACGRLLLGMPKYYDASVTPSLPGPTRTSFGVWFDKHPHILQGLAVLAILWQGSYLTWRVLFSTSGSNLLLWTALLIAEIYGFLALINLTVFSWRIPPGSSKTALLQLPKQLPSVDIFVCTYNESVAVLRPTLLGAKAINYPHTTYLLDDGRREEMRKLAQECGAVWITRDDNAHAKAGNINHALGVTRGELILILDADHVPLPDALDNLVGYFSEERLALVQTPHDFYNHDSAQHYEVGRHEQSVFFEVICPGKDRHDSAFWCGSATLVRRVALADVGGVATETIAEDYHTTIKMIERGWSTRYHDETIVQGVGPHDLDGYLLQRDRWARGNLSVLHTPESPLRTKRLTLMQRWSFAASLFGYGAAPARVLMLSVLAVVLWTGQLPLVAPIWVLALLWGPSLLLSLLAGNALCRGHMRSKDSIHFELLTSEIYTRALSCLFKPSRAKFKVTPKSGSDLGGWQAVKQLRLLVALTSVLALGVVARGLDLEGVPPFDYLPHMPSFAAWLVPALALLELRRCVRTLIIVYSRKQRRAEFRFGCDEEAAVLVGDMTYEGRLKDASTTGLRLVFEKELDLPEEVQIWLDVPTFSKGHQIVSVDGVMRSSRVLEDGSFSVSFQVASTPMAVPEALVEFCFIVCPARRLRSTGVVTAMIEAAHVRNNRIGQHRRGEAVESFVPRQQTRSGTLARKRFMKVS